MREEQGRHLKSHSWVKHALDLSQQVNDEPPTPTASTTTSTGNKDTKGAQSATSCTHAHTDGCPCLSVCVCVCVCLCGCVCLTGFSHAAGHEEHFDAGRQGTQK